MDQLAVASVQYVAAGNRPELYILPFAPTAHRPLLASNSRAKIVAQSSDDCLAQCRRYDAAVLQDNGETKEPEPSARAVDTEALEQTDGEVPSQVDAPLLPQQEALEAEQLQQQEDGSDYALLRDRCQKIASKQYGLLVDQIVAKNTGENENDKHVVVLTVGTTEVSCLADRGGEVLSLTESRKPFDQSSIEPDLHEAIRSRLPDDEALALISISNETASRQTGRIDGYRSTAYGFKARSNETLEIDLEANNPNAYFNVVSANMPYADALFVGLRERRNRAVIRIPRDGVYLVRPYLALAAARQKQSATYILRISRTTSLQETPAGKADKRQPPLSGKSDVLSRPN